MPDYTTTKYDNTKRMIRNFRNQDWSWEDITWASNAGHTEDMRNIMLTAWRAAGMVPNDLTVEDWCNIVEIQQELEDQDAGEHIHIPNGREIQPVNPNPNSCWNQYKNKLRQRGLADEVVSQLERSCQKIVQGYLAHGDNPHEPDSTRGMVIGNVQSGKTMHMAGVIAQAADLGFNYFIILTGIIDNLREQTEQRLLGDLNSDGNGDIIFHPITNPDRRFNYNTLRFAEQVGGFPNNNRYITVMLKNSSRLYNHLRWLYNDNNFHKQNMKILIIDDECDQASINTADIANEEATAINDLLRGEFFRKSVTRTRTVDENGRRHINYNFAALSPHAVKAINYIAYSATPYGNLLNDASEDSLYPFDYICALPPSHAYWGPTEFFKIPDWVNKDAEDFNDFDHLPFVNEVDDLHVAKAFNSGSNVIPESLKKAIHWFLCASAVQRLRGTVKPVSMLVHTHNGVNVHNVTGERIKEYLNSLVPETAREMLSECYEEQKQKLSLDDFEDRFEDYEFLNEITDYPPFDDIFPIITEILNTQATPILLDGDEEIQYHRGVHVCIDNCTQNGVQHGDDGQDFRMRIAYPKNELDFAPLFLIVGGNTLSRGLTLEGLVSSYFLRGTQNADSLMQMGRWFGYRKGYELLPRLWITSETLAKFQGLQLIDELLRNDLQRAAAEERTPRDFNVTIAAINIKGLNITAANKRQMAVPAGYNYSGRTVQFSSLDIREETLRHNYEFTTNFISSFGNQWHPQRVLGKSYLVENVDWPRIEEFFNGFERNNNGDHQMTSLLDHIRNPERGLTGRSWTVIIPGVEQDNNGVISIPNTPIQNLGIASRKISRHRENDWIKFKGITSPEDMLADIDPATDFAPERKWRKDEGVISYRYHATVNGKNQTPLLLIKPIVPKQEDGTVINLPYQLWSFFVFCPSDDGMRAANVVTGWQVGNMADEAPEE